ncbi:MAG: hypothetical protein ACKO0W_04415 [Planctomycetota bacterium]
MNWTVYALAVLVAAACDASFTAVFEVGGIRPQFLPAVVVFALFSAPKRISIRAAMLAGLVADLITPQLDADGTLLYLPGPHVLAFAFGAMVAVPLRGLLYRRNPLSGAAAVFAFSVAAGLVYVFVWTLRAHLVDGSAPWWPESGAGEVWRRGLVAGGNALLAIPTLWLLERTRGAWSFIEVPRLAFGPARESA